MKIRSFKLKLVLSYVFVVLSSFGVVFLFLSRNLEENSLRNIKTSLINQAYLIENQIIKDDFRNKDTADQELQINALSKKIQSRLTIINKLGKVFVDSEMTQKDIPLMESHLYRPEVKVALADGIGIDTRYSTTLKIDMLYVALPIKVNNEISGVLRLALPLTSVEEMLAQTRKIVFSGLILALVLAIAIGLIIAAQTIKPINRMIQVSRKFSQGDFSRRVLQSSQDEIGQLALTLNSMAQGLEDKVREIKSQNQKLAAIFNSMIEGVIVVDQSANIISINPTIEKIFNVLKVRVEGKAFLEMIRNNDISEVISSVLLKGIPLSSEVDLVLPVRKIFEVNAVPIFDVQVVSGCLIVIHDITEIRKLENIRRDFVANVSHELKTPLTSIKGFVETLLDGALDDKENNRNFLKIIQDHAQRLDNLVNDLLSLSYLESREIKLEKSSFNLKQQVNEVILGFRAQLEKKDIQIKNELSNDTLVIADKNRLEQVVINLIDNAIKFNKEKGMIRIFCETQDNKLKVILEDSGFGIPEKDIARIFERFYRVDKARSRQMGGTGLGLSIVKHIIELHNGSVGVESTEGLGSKFWFTLPR